jgi:hypothetical protein
MLIEFVKVMPDEDQALYRLFENAPGGFRW